MLTTSQLKGVHFFRALEQAHLDLVGALAEERRLDRGSIIFEEGDPGDSFYFLLKGEVRISKMIPNVGEEALAILEVGDYFGEMALLIDTPRSARATAHTGVIVAVISAETFKELIDKDRDLGYQVLLSFVRTLSQRLRDTDEKLSTFFKMVGGF